MESIMKEPDILHLKYNIEARKQRLEAKARRQFFYYHTKELEETQRMIAGYEKIVPKDDDEKLLIQNEIIRFRTLAARHLRALATGIPRRYRDYEQSAREREV